MYERVQEPEASPARTRLPGPGALAGGRLSNSQMASLVAARRPVFAPGMSNQTIQRMCCPSCAASAPCGSETQTETESEREPAAGQSQAAGAQLQRVEENTHEPHRIEGVSCTPYASSFSAQATKYRMYAQLLPLVLAVTGSTTNVTVWQKYLEGGGEVRRDDTTAPADPLVQSVLHDEGQVDGAVQAILGNIEPRLPQLAALYLSGTDSADIDVATLVSADLLRPNLAWVIARNPAANVIGEVGSSDVFGVDYRRISGTIRFTKQHRDGDRLTVDVRASTNLTIEVGDTADFCPGNIGPVFEQNFTIPLSRLEASGVAGDVHVVVTVHNSGRSTGLVNIRDPDVQG
ncbi:MAG: hypothetical protein NVSMB32_01660 [Actinomycetota bacterium]